MPAPLHDVAQLAAVYGKAASRVFVPEAMDNVSDRTCTCASMATFANKQTPVHIIDNRAQAVSFMSRRMTLLPRDLIVTGTAGKTQLLIPGDHPEFVIKRCRCAEELRRTATVMRQLLVVISSKT